ncbi:MAG: hypothetical protein IKU17_03720 [Clostridia bacterium]|nr:hypothetical protein [Clostridia bacterium]
MKKTMKPATRRLVITAAVLVVLAVAAFALLLPGSAQPGETSSVPVSSEAEGIVVISKDRATLDRVTIKNETGEFTIRAATEKDTTTNVFVLDELSHVATSGENLVNAARYAYDVEALLDIGPLAELPGLAEYGLDEPVVTMKAKYNDGSEDFTLLVGDEAASGGNYILAGDHVYTAEIASYVYADKYAFLEATIYNIPIVGNGSDVIDYLSLSGRMMEDELRIEYTGDDKNGPYNALFMPYIITEPHYSGMNTNCIDELVALLPAPSVAGTAWYDPDDAAMEKMGLADPYLVCDFSINGYAHVLKIGDRHELDSAYRYLMVDDSPIVLVMAETAMSALLDLNEMALRDGFVWSPMLKKTNGMTVTYEGEKYDFKLQRTEKEAATSGSAVTYDYTCTLNGAEFEYAKLQKLFSTAITPTVLSLDEVAKESKPVLTITYTYYEGGTNTVQYFAVTEGERRYAAYLDGKFAGLVKEAFVTDIINALPTE